jgi:signal transduction histidine kinase/GTP-sensing pleiotropic transcriptional regulator CodY
VDPSLTVPEVIRALAAVERELLAELDRDRLMQLIADRAGGLVGAEGAIYLLAGDHVVLAARTSEAVLVTPIAVGTGATGRCAETGEGLVVNDYATWPAALPASRARGVSRVMVQPLRMADALLGVISMSRRGDDAPAFGDEDHAVLARFAGQAALALRNANLYEEARQRRREAEGLAELARSVASLDTQQVLDTIVARLPDVLGAPVAVALRSGRLWRFASLQGIPARFLTFEPRHPRDGIIAIAIAERRAVWSADLLNDPAVELSSSTRQFIESTGQRAALAVPIVAGEQVLGALITSRGEPGSFSAEERRLLETAAAHAAVALANARSFEEAERRRREAEVVARIARTMSGSLDLDAILQKVADGARELCGSDLARIALRDPASGAMVLRYWVNARYPDYHPVPVERGQGVGGQVMVTGRPFRTDDWLHDPRISKEALPSVEAEEIVAMLAVPIRIGEQVEGLLYVDNRRHHPFTDRDEAVLMQLADHAALAIHDARLFAEAREARRRLQTLSARLLAVQEAERRRIARELHDEVGQALTAVKINLQMLKQPPPAAGVTEARIDETLGILDRTLRDVRQLSLDLRPSLLDDLGLIPALQWLVRVRAERAGLSGTVLADLPEGAVPDDLAITCFRVAQEAVTNVMRHAHATHVWVELRLRHGELELEVRDDGVGFDVATAYQLARSGASLGLLSLDERVELAGGRSVIESGPGRGTTVRAWLPLESSLAAGARPGERP